MLDMILPVFNSAVLLKGLHLIDIYGMKGMYTRFSVLNLYCVEIFRTVKISIFTNKNSFGHSNLIKNCKKFKFQGRSYYFSLIFFYWSKYLGQKVQKFDLKKSEPIQIIIFPFNVPRFGVQLWIPVESIKWLLNAWAVWITIGAYIWLYFAVLLPITCIPWSMWNSKTILFSIDAIILL